MLSPKKVKFRKQQKGRMRGLSHRGSRLNFGEFGLQAVELRLAFRSSRSKRPVSP